MNGDDRLLVSRTRRRLCGAAVIVAAVACQSRSETADRGDDSTPRDVPAADSAAAVPGGAPAQESTARDTTAAQSPESPSAKPTPAGRLPRPAPSADSVKRDAPPPPAAAGVPRPGSASDSVRGVVRVVGSSPFRQVVVSPAEGQPAVTIVGPDTATLRKAAGLDVVVRGERAGGGRELRLASFAVRGAEGQPAVDGVVVRDGDGLALDTEQGRVRLGNPPSALRDLVGARVWVAGPLDTGPNPYGVLKGKE